MLNTRTSSNFIDMTGRSFGHLIVVCLDHFDQHRFSYWRCRCVCGNEVIRRGHALRTGRTTSCGCARGKHKKIHTGAYKTWIEMRRRCLDPKSNCYANYGAKGITICDRWMSFANFYEDMGDRPLGMTIDRKDNSKGYEPSNCRWATHTEQIRNRRTTRMLTFNGTTLCMKEWANRTGIPYQCIRNRINILGWSVEDALTQPRMMTTPLSKRK